MTIGLIRRNMVLGTVAAVLFGCASYVVAQATVTDRVPAHDTDTWTIWAPSGASRVVVDGDGDTDLDCYVKDRDGLLLGMDDDSTDYCIVEISQRYGGDIRVEIVNLGNVYNEYTLRITP